MGTCKKFVDETWSMTFMLQFTLFEGREYLQC